MLGVKQTYSASYCVILTMCYTALYDLRNIVRHIESVMQLHSEHYEFFRRRHSVLSYIEGVMHIMHIAIGNLGVTRRLTCAIERYSQIYCPIGGNFRAH